MTEVPLEDRTRLLSDNGSGYVSRAFRDYLGLVGIRHIRAAPHHPQTNGKLERYHQSIKQEVNQVPYEVPSDLEEAIAGFVDYYNHRCYDKAVGNLTPDDVLQGRREEILVKRREVKVQTLAQRKRYDRLLRESQNTAIPPWSLLNKSVPLLLVANTELPTVIDSPSIVITVIPSRPLSTLNDAGIGAAIRLLRSDRETFLGKLYRGCT